MVQATVTHRESWRRWWTTQGAGGADFPLEHFRQVFLRFGTFGAIIFCALLAVLVVAIREGHLVNAGRFYITELDMWGMIIIVLTWTPLGLGLLRFSQRLPLSLNGIVVILYWSMAITCTNIPADIATGAIVIYYGIMIITASFLLPSWTCLALAAFYGAIMFFCSWLSHAQIRLFDIAGLALAGAFSWFTGNVLEASYHFLHELNSSLRESNQSLAAENQRRAKLEAELRLAMGEAEKANRLKGQFLANVSHEIRTPLTSIIGFTHLLLKTRLEPEQRDYLLTVRRSGDLLLTLLNDILDFSKIESQQLKLENIDFDLEYVLNSVAELIRERLLEKPVAFRFDYPAELPRYFKGDPTRLRQVFINLLGNAVKFTASGEVALVVSEEGTPPGGEAPVRRLSLTVRDTGIGIPPERQADVFKAFVQGDGSTTRKFGGTGLGLTITRELVERMGGTIDLDSAAGQGSSFTVRLPLPEGQPAWGKAFCLPSLKELNGLGALLIEGNPEDRMLLTRYLLDLGLRVAYLASGTAEALAWFNQHAPEIALVLCDTQLYDEGGATFAQTLGRRPDRKKFKLLAINQDAQPGNSRLAQAEGFDGYLAKPVRQAEFVRVVVGVLGDQRPDRDQIINRHLMQEFVQRNVSVLVAEDNDINRLLVKTLLEKMGCRVETAQNGREAVTALGARAFDLLLMDVQMPELDGLKATREIREKLGLDIPIIALTADTLDEDAAECRRAGMNDYLSKPIDVKQLQEKILAWTQNPSNRQPSA